MISREQVESIIAKQDIRELARIAYRHAEPTKDGYVPEAGAAVLNLKSGRVYGSREWQSFPGDPPQPGEEYELILVLAPSEFHADDRNPRLSMEEYVEQEAREGLRNDEIEGQLRDLYYLHEQQ